jgi:hypothetical protein
VPVALVSKSGDVQDYRAAPPMVSIKVSGPPQVMAVLQGNQIRPFIDLSDLDPTSKNLRRRVEVSTPPGVTLVSVDPPQVGIIVPQKNP